MKKEIRTADTKKGIVQVTTVDERWYCQPVENPTTKLPEYKFVPSVTWIAESYPKGVGFYKWLADKGWDEAEALKVAAGDKGSKVHYAITQLLKAKSVRMDDKFSNPDTGKDEELTLEEYECILSFADWYNEVKPEIINNEFVVWNNDVGYAGTVDIICKIGEDTFIIDLKTSQNIYPSHEIQLSAYKHASGINAKLAVLQLGYWRNKKKFKFTEVEDQFPLFLAAKQIWQKEHGGEKPKQKDYPVEIKI